MAIWIKADGSEQRIKPANGRAFTLKELQHYVGGYIEAVQLANGRVMWLNEDGKGLELPYNPLADAIAHALAGIPSQDYVVGDVLIADREESGEGGEEK